MSSVTSNSVNFLDFPVSYADLEKKFGVSEGLTRFNDATQNVIDDMKMSSPDTFTVRQLCKTIIKMDNRLEGVPDDAVNHPIHSSIYIVACETLGLLTDPDEIWYAERRGGAMVDNFFKMHEFKAAEDVYKFVSIQHSLREVIWWVKEDLIKDLIS